MVMPFVLVLGFFLLFGLLLFVLGLLFLHRIGIVGAQASDLCSVEHVPHPSEDVMYKSPVHDLMMRAYQNQKQDRKQWAI